MAGVSRAVQDCGLLLPLQQLLALEYPLRAGRVPAPPPVVVAWGQMPESTADEQVSEIEHNTLGMCCLSLEIIREQAVQPLSWMPWPSGIKACFMR